MNTALWIVSGLCAFAFVAAGSMKLLLPKEKLATKMKWAGSWPAGRLKLLGLAEILGAVGLIAPAATGIAPILTPIAAVCLVVIMLGAVKTHLDLKESPAPPAILAALLVAIAVGRFMQA